MSSTNSDPLFDQTGRMVRLDGLRGIAILSVIFFHWLIAINKPLIEPVLYEIVKQTDHGVDMFFVISGFLIGTIFLRHCGSQNFLKAFFIRRFSRIVPFYFLVLTILILMDVFMPSPLMVDCSEQPTPHWSFYLFINNMMTAFGGCRNVPFAPFWSLAIEEQFYVFGAFTAVVFGRRGILVFAIVCALGSPVIRTIIAVAELPISVGHFSFSHFDPIGIGLLTAFVLDNPEWHRRVIKHLPKVRLACLVLVPSFFLIPLLPPLVWSVIDISAISILTALAILLISCSDRGQFLTARWLVLSGRACFGLYILHEGIKFWLVTAFLEFEITFLAIPFASAAVLVALAYLSFRFLETPLINWGHRWSYQQSSPAKSG